jgi:hypothetical protein
MHVAFEELDPLLQRVLEGLKGVLRLLQATSTM